MDQEKFKCLIHSIFASEEESQVCSEFFEQLPRYVEVETSGQDAVGQLPEVALHLQQCLECGELYQALTEVMKVEDLKES
jgi:hypothetical protein